MGMRKIVRARDMVKIRKYAEKGHDAAEISRAMGIDYDRICDLMPKKKRKRKATAPIPQKEELPAPVPGSTAVS